MEPGGRHSGAVQQRVAPPPHGILAARATTALNSCAPLPCAPSACGCLPMPDNPSRPPASPNYAPKAAPRSSPGPLRIGFALYPGDPFWVQVREAAKQRALELGPICARTADYRVDHRRNPLGDCTAGARVAGIGDWRVVADSRACCRRVACRFRVADLVALGLAPPGVRPCVIPAGC